MTLPLDGKQYLRNTDYQELTTSKFFPNKTVAATFAERLQLRVDQGAIWPSTMSIVQDDLEDYSVLTVIIVFSDGISETMLTKLDELLNT